MCGKILGEYRQRESRTRFRRSGTRRVSLTERVYLSEIVYQSTKDSLTLDWTFLIIIDITVRKSKRDMICQIFHEKNTDNSVVE